MNILDEALMERYVRFRSTLSERDLEEAERLLQSSDAARDLVDFFEGFYGEIDAISSPTDPLPPQQPDPASCEGGLGAMPIT